MLIGVVRNPRSHANLHGRPLPSGKGAVAIVEPASAEQLAADLAGFAKAGVELIVVDGGDGTVREVLTALPGAFKAVQPALAVVPSGKTNILAFDLRTPRAWTTDRMVAAAGLGILREQRRAPLEVRRKGDSAPVRGFVFGAAGFVRGTALAGGAHKAKVFHNSALALAIGGAVAESISGEGRLRDGAPLTLTIDGGEPRSGARLVTMATTLERLPFAMRPFGRGPGLKVLDVDAPPRDLTCALPRLLWTEQRVWLASRGYRRGPAAALTVDLAGDIVIDGEVYPGGVLTITPAPQQRFMAP